MDVELRRAGPDDWQLWRDTRLAALADSPRAFGSTLARERDYDEATWRASLVPERGLKTVAAGPDGTVLGMAGGWVPPDRGGAAELWGMWVAPAHRGRGVAGALIGEVLDWARAEAHPRVELWVVGDNAAARRLYARLGFRETGETQAYPPDPAVAEHLMAHAL